MPRLPLLACLVLAQPALAEDAPSFDCEKAQSSAEEMICGDPELAELDRLVALRFGQALDAVQSVAQTDAENTLRSIQRGWIKGRDTCWSAADAKECIQSAYLLQEGALVAHWMLEEPTQVTTWTCGDTPANELVIMFFDTKLPSIRLESGDEVATGSLAPTGSGTRYAGDFGRSILIQGDQAIYREPDPIGTTYDCVLVPDG